MVKSFALCFNVSMFDLIINDKTTIKQPLNYYCRNESSLQ